ncbi:ABC transporter permease [bacterium]|nr:ABC transporter permease [bacterium]
MFKNYLKITWRNIIKQRGYSFINIAGLAIGMTCSMLILMWVQHERSYDTFHQNASDIYRVVENQYYAGGEIFPVAVTPAALAPALKERFPEIIKSTRLTFRTWTLKYGTKIFNQMGVLVDHDFFEIFTVPFIEGDPRTALSEPHAIVLTEEMAVKYFGEEEPIGKVLTLNSRDDFVVSGVIENFPENSHFDFDYIVPFLYLGELGARLDNWGSNSYYTYVQLQPNTSYQEVDKKILNFIKENRERSSTEIYLQPLTKIHLYSRGKYTADIGGHGDIQYVRIFSLVAVFVLLIASINFMNLATARSERRGKEVGLRKVVGAQRHQILRQFFGESLFMSLAAFIVALACSYLLLPLFNELSGKQLFIGELGLSMLAAFIGIAVLTGLVSGSYPALFLSSFRPAETLKAGGGSRSSSSLFRKILVVTQFALSVIMIIGTLVVSQQLDYIRNKNLGLDKENLAYVWMRGEYRDKYEIAKQELLRNPNITSVTVTSQLPTYVAQSTSGWDWDGKNPDDNILMHHISVDYDYVETFKMEMAAGRFFSLEFATDSVAAIVNERAVDIMGLEFPVGKRLSIGSSDLTIIGVVKNFHFKPIQTEIEPIVMFLSPNRYYVMVLRTNPENISTTIDYVESVYKKFNPETPFSFHFLDDRYDNLYRAEQRIGKISRYFAIIAILISSLGLFGLASFMAEQRTKEIGIRKVLGASVPGIFVLLSKSFVFLVGLANLIAWPIAYYFMTNWLENYAYHTSLGWSIFLLAALLAVTVVVFTVSYQAVRAALANPVNSLRYE